MKIAIHNSGGFAPRWIEYCKKNNIDYKIVNAYDSDIVEQVADCDAFMWHTHHHNYKDVLFAKQLLFSLQQAGKVVFPNFNTGWHFDDKVGEKYLLEAIGAPIVPSYVFYTKKEAFEWIKSTSFPKVFKLRGGAGSMNVKLAKNPKEAKRLVSIAFGKGFSQYDGWEHVKESFRKFHQGLSGPNQVIKDFVKLFVKPEYGKMLPYEKGYVYFQDFVPNNVYDIRICVVGDKAYAIRRNCRNGDFRASGSGNLVYDINQIDERCVKISFEVNKKIQSQSLALDFVFDENNKPLIVEISYGYTAPAYDLCEGYWTSDMQWHEGSGFDFCGWMVENLMKNINKNF